MKKLLGKGMIVTVMTLAMVGIFILGGFSSAVAEADTTASNAKEISVNGVGAVMVKPDIAVLNIGVETQNKDSKVAQEENAKLTNQLLETLKKLNIKEADIKTTGFNMYRERYYNTPDGKPTEGDYRVIHSLSVTIRKIDEVGSIIDTVTKNGANQVNGIYFTVADSSPYYHEALKNAIENASGKGNAIAKALGVKIGKPSSVVEISYSEPVVQYMDTAVAKESLNMGTSISAGELEIRAQVQVIYNY